MALFPQIPSITIGGRVFTQLTDAASPLIILTATIQNPGSQYAGALKMGSGATTAYQVTAGKTLHIFAMKTINGTASAAGVDVGYGDTAVTIGGQVGAPTTPIFFSTGTSTAYGLVQVGAAAGAVDETALHGTIPATKYVQISTGSSLYVYLYGYEV